jgi:hypothetical protein
MFDPLQPEPMRIPYPPDGKWGMVLVVFDGVKGHKAQYASAHNQGSIDWELAEKLAMDEFLHIKMALGGFSRKAEVLDGQ